MNSIKKLPKTGTPLNVSQNPPAKRIISIINPMSKLYHKQEANNAT